MIHLNWKEWMSLLQANLDIRMQIPKIRNNHSALRKSIRITKALTTVLDLKNENPRLKKHIKLPKEQIEAVTSLYVDICKSDHQRYLKEALEKVLGLYTQFKIKKQKYVN